MGKESERSFNPESFHVLHEAQEHLAKQGYLFYPIPKEHAEGQVTQPLLHRLHTQIKKRGFGNVAGRVFLTFSGFAHDPREIFQIPEIRRFWQQLDRQLPELPALPALAERLGYNGPGAFPSAKGRIRRHSDSNVPPAWGSMARPVLHKVTP